MSRQTRTGSSRRHSLRTYLSDELATSSNRDEELSGDSHRRCRRTGNTDSSNDDFKQYTAFAVLISKLMELKFGSFLGFDFVKATYLSGRIDYVAVDDNLELWTPGQRSGRRCALAGFDIMKCFQQLDAEHNCFPARRARRHCRSCLDRAFRSTTPFMDFNLCPNCKSLKSLLTEMASY